MFVASAWHIVRQALKYYEKNRLKVQTQRSSNHRLCMAVRDSSGLYGLHQNQNISLQLIRIHLKPNQNGCYTHYLLCNMLHCHILALF